MVELRSRTTFLILFFLAFTILAGDVTQARGVAKKGVAQEVSKEEILAKELSELMPVGTEVIVYDD